MSKKTEELLKKIRKRFALMTEADRDNRRMAMQDIEFTNIPGEQWDDNMKQERGDRPCYEFNKLRVTCKRIINDMRANRPQGKVRGVEGSDKDTAEVYEGLIRNIWNISDGDTVIDYAAEYQVPGGMGAWRIVTEYASDAAFEQDIKLETIHNPFCLWFDPAAKDLMKRDAVDCIFSERISKSAYEARWPKAEVVSFDEVEFDDQDEWESDDSVRIAEYWYKEPVDKEIWQIEGGKVIDAGSDEAQLLIQQHGEGIIKNRRTVKTHKVMQCIVSGDALLEGPTEWAGKELPFVVVHGEYVVIDGKIYWFGVTRFAKDAQRAYNVSRTAIAESIAMAPQAKFWTTPDQAAGHVDKWAEAHRKNFPFMLYNPDPKAPGAPQRMGGADVPIALIQESQLASEELKAVTGIFSPDLGAGDAAKSGVQERERRAQGQLATFNYQDNLAKGIRRTWEILIDLIPNIYDTERELRILGADGAEDYVRINQVLQDPRTGEPVTVRDMAAGKYDVTVTVGPSFTTQRQEAAETYMTLAQANPAIFGIAGDLIFKSMDLPYSEDIAERLKTMLPPEVKAMIDDGQGQQSPEVMAAMQQAAQAMQMVEQQMQQVQMAAQEIQQEKAQSEQAKAEVEKAIAGLKTEEAKFEAKIAKEIARLTKIESHIDVAGSQLENKQIIAGEENAIAPRVKEYTDALQTMADQFAQQATAVLADIEAKSAQKPKVVRVESKRVNGKLVAVPIYDTEPEG